MAALSANPDPSRPFVASALAVDDMPLLQMLEMLLRFIDNREPMVSFSEYYFVEM